MFTIEQIHEAFNKAKSGADFPQFVQDLKLIGVLYYDNFVSDGRTIYFGLNNFMLQGVSKYLSIEVNNVSSCEKLKTANNSHQQGQTDYLTFCKQAAESGVERWRTHMIEMTVTYLDRLETKLTVEPIPDPV
jgi:uncharacterized protein YbcV (DUF1398 family)